MGSSVMLLLLVPGRILEGSDRQALIAVALISNTSPTFRIFLQALQLSAVSAASHWTVATVPYGHNRILLQEGRAHFCLLSYYGGPIGSHQCSFDFLGRRHISTSGFASTATQTAVSDLFLPVHPSNMY